MEQSLYKPMYIFMIGITVIYIIERLIFRNRSIEFKVKYHPFMAMGYFIGFGLIAVIVMYSDESNPKVWWPIPVFLLLSTIVAGYLYMKKIIICMKCGHEVNPLFSNRRSTLLVCPKCGETYDK